MKTAYEFCCFSCKSAVTVLNDEAAFCDKCKTLYWINENDEIEYRIAHAVEQEPKVKC